MEFKVYPFYEIERVCLDVTVDPAALAKGKVGYDLTVAQVRDLAKQLTEAADHVDEWNRSIEEYFASHGAGSGGGGQGVHADDPEADPFGQVGGG